MATAHPWLLVSVGAPWVLKGARKKNSSVTLVTDVFFTLCKLKTLALLESFQFRGRRAVCIENDNAPVSSDSSARPVRTGRQTARNGARGGHTPALRGG